MIKKAITIFLICTVISCAFSTRGGISNVKQSVTLDTSKKKDTIKVIKYVERAPLTKAQQDGRDSIFKNYIAGIVKPFTEDLKNSNTINITNLTSFIKGQGYRLDSINTLRYLETYRYQLASAQRDSFLLQSLIKDKRIDSLRADLQEIKKASNEANKISQGLTILIVTVRDVAFYAIIGLALVYVSLTLFLEWKKKKYRQYKLIKQHE